MSKSTELDAVLQSIVSIKFYTSINFDVHSQCSSQATGFVVDKRGYIVTNHHVAQTGPWRGRAVFNNHEECSVRRVYTDPIHDFSLLAFDPAEIIHMKLSELQLRPDLVKVGEEIRVIGNDAGEKLSILPGVISRTDRNPPEYARGGYRDFDTNYIQAAVNGSGGSSGSPVINSDNFAVAMVGGGREQAGTNYFLPLDRVLRALLCLQSGSPISRGTIQCAWLWTRFKDCEQLGLSKELKEEVTANVPNEMGMLVATTVLPEGPSDNKIKVGDVLVRVNGNILTKFVLLDGILDSLVRQQVELTLQRGPNAITVTVDVEDLHQLSPDRYISATGSIFHKMSIQKALAYNRPCKGVVVSGSTGSFKSVSSFIIQSIDNKKTPDLDTFQNVLMSIPDRARIVVCYMDPRDQNKDEATIQVDHYWTGSMKLVVRQANSDKWDQTIFAEPLPAVPVIPRSGKFSTSNIPRFPEEQAIIESQVTVEFIAPIPLDGAYFSSESGSATILDAEKGIAIVSRSVVYQDLGNISITIADSITIDAEIIIGHPTQNYVFIKFDPSLVEMSLRSAKLSKDPIKVGATVYFVGASGKQLHVDQTTVIEILPMNIESNASNPRYRAVNMDGIKIASPLGADCPSGLLTIKDEVQAFWMEYIANSGWQGYNTYHRGLEATVVAPVLEDLRRGITPEIRILDIEFDPLDMSRARTYKVSEEWIKKVEDHDSGSRKLFRVKKLAARFTERDETLVEGDILLTLNGNIITRFLELNEMQRNEDLEARVVRSGTEMVLKVRTILAKDIQTVKLIKFCGAVIQEPHLAVKQHTRVLPSQVYVSRVSTGPARHYRLPTASFITAVNNEKALSLENFNAVVSEIADDTDFRVDYVSIRNIPDYVIMRKNENDFPTQCWIKDPLHPRGWRQTEKIIGGTTN